LTGLFPGNCRFARRANSSQIVSLVTTGKSLAVLSASSAHQEGRFAIVTKRGAEDAVDAGSASDECAFRGRRSRGVLISRRWYQLAMMLRITRGWWQESPITRETTKETVKTNRAGNAGTLRRTCGD